MDVFDFLSSKENMLPCDWLSRARSVLNPDDVDVVAYHSPCTDGVCAAAIVHWALIDKNKRVRSVPLQHGSPCPTEVFRGQRVLMVDFSYKRDVMLAVHACCAALLVLDHHASAERELMDLPFAVFDMQRSGAVMAHCYMHGDDCAMPPAVRLVDDADRWKFALRQTRAFRLGITGHEQQFDFDYWRALLNATGSNSDNDNADALIELLRGRGARELAALQQAVDAIVRRATRRVLRVPPLSSVGDSEHSGGDLPSSLHVSVVETRDYISDVGDALFAAHGLVCIILFHDETRDVFVVSLRGRAGGTDLGALAQRFGGGGHSGAAGFTWRQPLEELFSD